MQIGTPQRLGPKQAAARIGVAVRTLAEWRHRKIGPAFIKSETRRVYYLYADIEEWERRNFAPIKD